MNYIEKKAMSMAGCIMQDSEDANNILQIVKDDLYDVDDETDKVSYLSIVLEANENAYNEHLKICKNKETCDRNRDYEMIHYFLQQELRRIGVSINEDAFSREEKEDLSEYLDKIMTDLNDLKDGQQIIYDDLKEEIEELKKWFLIGKKNWRQMAVGKFSEMVAGGIVSESIAKPIIDTIKKELIRLIS